LSVLDNKAGILKAAALEYTGKAPRLKAYGKGDAAKAIIEMARKFNVKIIEKESDDLLEMLSQIKINTEIPPELYLAIARIYSYFYFTKDRKKQNS